MVLVDEVLNCHAARGACRMKPAQVVRGALMCVPSMSPNESSSRQIFDSTARYRTWFLLSRSSAVFTSLIGNTSTCGLIP